MKRETRPRPKAAQNPSAQLGPQNRHARRRAANAERILEAAAQLLAAAGHADVTMDTVAQAADVSRATLFNHFASKQDLLAAHHRRLFAAFHSAADVAESKLESSADPLLRLMVIFTAAERVLLPERALVRVLHAAVLRDDAMLAIDEDLGEKFARRIVAALDAGCRQGTLRRDLDVQLAARMVVDLWTASLRDWARREGGLRLRTQMERKLETLFRGLRRG